MFAMDFNRERLEILINLGPKRLPLGWVLRHAPVTLLMTLHIVPAFLIIHNKRIKQGTFHCRQMHTKDVSLLAATIFRDYVGVVVALTGICHLLISADMCGFALFPVSLQQHWLQTTSVGARSGKWKDFFKVFFSNFCNPLEWSKSWLEIRNFPLCKAKAFFG